MSIKKSNDTIGNRTHDLLTCSAVPQPTVPPRAAAISVTKVRVIMSLCFIKHQVTTMYEEIKVEQHAFLTATRNRVSG